MPNPFDMMQSAMMDVVSRTMGYDAIWIDYATSSPLATARVLFKAPTKKDNMQEVEYDFDFYTMEYKFNDFEGLDVLAANPRNKATVSIEGVVYRVRKVIKKYDGKTNIALLDKPE